MPWRYTPSLIDWLSRKLAGSLMSVGEHGRRLCPLAVVRSPEVLHPGFQIFVDELARLQSTGVPAWHQLSALQLRALTQDMRKSADPIEGIERRDLQVAGAESLISARLYVPAGIEKHSAGLVYFHGGGFAIGSVDTHDSIVANLARSSGIRILSVDYRLGPEFPFPAAHDDALESSRWAFDHAEEIGFDRSRIAIGGDSAGANLAASTCLAMRGDRDRRIAFQLLAYPNTTILGSRGSRTVYADGHYLTLAATHHLFQFYVDERSSSNDRINLLGCSDLAGLPPALLVVAHCDILFDEGLIYGAKLRDAGVSVEIQTYPGFIHGFLGFSEQVPEVLNAFKAIGNSLATALRRKQGRGIQSASQPLL